MGGDKRKREKGIRGFRYLAGMNHSQSMETQTQNYGMNKVQEKIGAGYVC